MRGLSISIIIAVVVCLSVEAWCLVNPTVVLMRGSQSVINAGSVVIPSVIKGAAGATASIALTGTAATVAGIAATAAISYVAAGAAAGLGSWMSDQLVGYILKTRHNNSQQYSIINGQIGYNESTYIPPAGYPWVPGWNHITLGHFATSGDAYNAEAAWKAASGYPQDVSEISYRAGTWGKCYTMNTGHGGDYREIVGFFECPSPEYNTAFIALTQGQISTDVNNGLTTGEYLPLVQTALQKISDNITGLRNDLGTALPGLRTALDALITTGQGNLVTGEPTVDQTYVDNAINAQSAADIGSAVSQALRDNPAPYAGPSASQIASAINGTEPSVPTEPDVPVPTKLSLTTVMESFYSSVSSLPMINTLRGLTINAGGSSVLCLTLPSNLGGSRCWDAAPLTGTINGIGTVLLSLTTLFSFVSIFRG